MPALALSVPLSGPTGRAGADAAEAVRLAVEDAGSALEPVVLDAGPGICGPNVPANAERAASDGAVVAYLGEFHSAATEVSLPVLEAGGVPHVSFSNTFRRLVGRSFVNVMPSDELQAVALVAWMSENGVARPFLADDGEDYGADMRWLVHRALAAAGGSVAGAVRLGNGLLSKSGPDADASPGAALGRADAVFLGAAIDDHSAALLAALHERAPHAPLFAMEGLLDDGFAASLPAEVAERLRVTAGPACASQLPAAGQAVAERLRERLGHVPDAHAVYAYEGASLVLDAHARVGDDHAALVADLRGTRGRDSVVGRYGIDAHGATTLPTAGRLRVENGRFVPA
jgi:branched-chain amino acid transport system substrate-binding protein